MPHDKIVVICKNMQKQRAIIAHSLTKVTIDKAMFEMEVKGV
jgi:hypothetical protein